MIQIGNDFQGWPINTYTLRNILKMLGFEEADGKISMNADNELLDAYPMLLEDDGMGYGVRPEYITEVDTETYDVDVNTINYNVGEDPKLDIEEVVQRETIKVFNVFRDVPEHNIKDDE